MISFSIFLFFLVRSSFANFEDLYPENPDNYNLYTEEFLDPDEGDIEKRDNHFMRFGRNSGENKKKEYIYDDYDDSDIKTKRSGNHHVRFGRSGTNSFMRFGRNQSKGRNKSMYMRIGRNFQDRDDKIRSKRSAPLPPTDPNYPKRKDYFMRFGKSPSFMRYGRNPDQGIFDSSDGNRALLDQLSSEGMDFQRNYFKEANPLDLLLAKLLTRRHSSEGSL